MGEPSWTLDGTTVLDGRTRPGRRLTFVVRSEDLFDEVMPDWTGFRQSPFMDEVVNGVIETVQEMLQKLLSSRIKETTDEVLSDHREGMRDLQPGERREVVEVAHTIAEANPLLSAEAMSVAVGGVIEAKRKGSLQLLIHRITALPEEDIDGLRRLLDEWTVKDALTVLDEIGRRIRTVELLEKLAGDPKTDELRVLHPLVTHARWLFGPQFDSPLYSSNISLRNAVQKVFGSKPDAASFENPKKRPDLLVAPDRTISAVGADEIDLASGISRLRSVLLVELKKGGAAIGRDQIMQGEGYIEDLVHCGLIDGPPYVHAFVVGHEVAPLTTAVKRVGEKPELGRVEAVTFGQLIRTANSRLYRLRDQVQDRYPEDSREILGRLAHGHEQLGLLDPPVPSTPSLR